MASIAKPPCDEAAILARPCQHPAPTNGPWILAATILASSMAFIDGTVVNVALPALQSSFGASLADVQWVVESYALFLAALLLIGGSMGDLYGRRKIFAAGVVIFSVSSAWCGLAPGIRQLIVARGLQGIGGALLVPGSLALISAPPIPWSPRATINCRMPGASPHQAEDTENITTPAVKILRRPYRSPIDPPMRSSAARKRAYDSTTHCTSARLAPNDDCNAGNATLTTVPSMNAMLEARMVAARIQAPLVGAGSWHGLARIAASSQGGLAILAIFHFAPARPAGLSHGDGTIGSWVERRRDRGW